MAHRSNEEKRSHQSPEDKQKLQMRLRRIEGQVRGIQRMIENDQYCIDVLTQISGAQSALAQVSLLLMEKHLQHCVVEAVQEGKEEEKITEIMQVLQRYTRM